MSLPDLAKRPAEKRTWKRNNNFMKCIHCDGPLKRIKISYTSQRKGYQLILDEVPAWVCQQCGQPTFDETTVDAVQEYYTNLTNISNN
jgi:YgiT-type zinc finger domain-containing protein